LECILLILAPFNVVGIVKIKLPSPLGGEGQGEG